MKMTKAEHIELHKKLHRSLDELVADWLTITHKMPSHSSVMELMTWAFEQTVNPTEMQE